ncbi:hypothetical protein CSE16_09375 [Solibacillus sp. R5-41]|nr:hypothetical protein CSE16_09375 [Solibacillus sp. R5-41]
MFKIKIWTKASRGVIDLYLLLHFLHDKNRNGHHSKQQNDVDFYHQMISYHVENDTNNGILALIIKPPEKTIELQSGVEI